MNEKLVGLYVRVSDPLQMRARDGSLETQESLLRKHVGLHAESSRCSR